MKSILSLLSILLATQLFATGIHYKLSMTEPHTHYFEVTVEVSDITDKESIDFSMPVWAPGSYLVREFAKGVESVSAENSNREELAWEQIDKNTWRVQTNKAEAISFHYKVYSFEMSVRTSFLDDRHAYINGTSVFMLVEGEKETPVELTIKPHESFKHISTALTKNNEKPNKFEAIDYDVFVDAPIEIGNHVNYKFMVDDVPHHVAMFGAGNYNMDTLLRDMEKISMECVKVFGTNPNGEYTYIVHNQTERGGGLEHLSSTTLQVNRWQYNTRKGYQSFISLCAHEYFHLWNVKRIRPIELGPFDYSNENHTKLLYVSEGFTSYYDQYLLRRADFYTEQEFLDALAGEITYTENLPGNDVQPVSESSFNAWTKAYRRNENYHNTNVSYYGKGSLIALILDLEIRSYTNGEKNLDHLMQHLYNEYHIKQKRGFTSEEFEKDVAAMLGRDMSKFFNEYVHGVTQIPYQDYLNYVGLELVDKNTEQKVAFGAKYSEKNGVYKIYRVMRGTSAYESGLNVNDEIIAVNGYRLTKGNESKLIKDAKEGDTLEVTISRDNIIRTIPVKMIKSTKHDYELKKLEKPSKQQAKLYKAWMYL